MTMNLDQANGTATPAPLKKRFGLVAARVGSTHVHKLGIPMPIAAPLYSTASAANARPARVKSALGARQPTVERDAAGNALRVLPGGQVALEVQDASRLPPELRALVKWTCRHPDCAGHHFKTRSELVQAHADNRVLVEEAERSPEGRPHLYYGFIEVEGRDGQPEERHGDKVVRKAVEATDAIVMLVSEEI